MVDRSKARDFIFKFVYNIISTDHKLGSIDLPFELKNFEETLIGQEGEHLYCQISKQELEFATSILSYLTCNYDSISSKINEKLVKDISKLSKVDLTLLLIGLSEMEIKKTPPKVVIKETLILANTYGQNESSSLINGVLDKFKG